MKNNFKPLPFNSDSEFVSRNPDGSTKAKTLLFLLDTDYVTCFSNDFVRAKLNLLMEGGVKIYLYRDEGSPQLLSKINVSLNYASLREMLNTNQHTLNASPKNLANALGVPIEEILSVDEARLISYLSGGETDFTVLLPASSRNSEPEWVDFRNAGITLPVLIPFLVRYCRDISNIFLPHDGSLQQGPGIIARFLRQPSISFFSSLTVLHTWGYGIPRSLIIKIIYHVTTLLSFDVSLPAHSFGSYCYLSMNAMRGGDYQLREDILILYRTIFSRKYKAIFDLLCEAEEKNWPMIEFFLQYTDILNTLTQNRVDELFTEACQACAIDVVLLLLEKCTSSVQRRTGDTPLHMICRAHSDAFTVIQYFITQNPDYLYVRNTDNQTPFDLIYEKSPRAWEAIRVFLRKENNFLRFLKPYQIQKLFPEVDSIKYPDIKASLLQEYCALSPHVFPIEGDTVFHLSCRANEPGLLKYYIEKQPRTIFLKNTENKTPFELLYYADSTNFPLIKIFLEQKGFLEKLTKAQVTTLFSLAHDDNAIDIMVLLSDKYPDLLHAVHGENTTVVHFACWLNNLEFLLSCVGSGSGFEGSLEHQLAKFDSAGFTPLHIAAANHVNMLNDLILAIRRNNDYQSLVYLIAMQSGEKRETVLHILARNRDEQAIISLFQFVLRDREGREISSDHGHDTYNTMLRAAVCARDQKNNTYLHIACYQQLENLLQYVASNFKIFCDCLSILSIQNNDGETIFHVLANKDCWTLIIDLLEKINQASPAMLVQVFSLQNKDGHTFSHIACIKNAEEFIVSVCKKFPKVLHCLTTQNSKKDTIIHCLAKNKSWVLVTEFLKILQQFVDDSDFEGFVTTTNQDGDSIFHLASQTGAIKAFLDCVLKNFPLLLYYSNVKDNKKNTILHILAYKKEWDIARKWLDAILTMGPTEFLDFMNAKNNLGESFLDIAIAAQENFTVYFSKSWKSWPSIMSFKSRGGGSLLHDYVIAGAWGEIFETLCELAPSLPPVIYKDFVTRPDDSGNAFFHIACMEGRAEHFFPALFKASTGMTEDNIQLLPHLTFQNRDGDTILHIVSRGKYDDSCFIVSLMSTLHSHYCSPMFLKLVFRKNNDGCTVLHNIAKYCPENLSAILQALEERMSDSLRLLLIARDKTNSIFLHHVGSAGQSEITYNLSPSCFEHLLPFLGITDNIGRTVFHVLAERGLFKNIRNMIRMFKESPGDEFYFTGHLVTQNLEKNTFLHSACYHTEHQYSQLMKLIKFICKHLPSVLSRLTTINKKEETFLHVFAKYNGWGFVHLTLEALQWLLDESAFRIFCALQDEEGNTFFHLACKANQINFLNVFASHFPLTLHYLSGLRNNADQTPLDILNKRKEREKGHYFEKVMLQKQLVVSLLYSFQKIWPFPPIEQAFYTNSRDMLILFLQEFLSGRGDIDLNHFSRLCNDPGNAPAVFKIIRHLFNSVEANSIIFRACRLNQAIAMRFLIYLAQVDINITDGDGNTLFHIACQYSARNVITYLVRSSIDLSVKNNDGKTGLDILQTVSCIPAKFMLFVEMYAHKGESANNTHDINEEEEDEEEEDKEEEKKREQEHKHEYKMDIADATDLTILLGKNIGRDRLDLLGGEFFLAMLKENAKEPSYRCVDPIVASPDYGLSDAIESAIQSAIQSTAQKKILPTSLGQWLTKPDKQTGETPFGSLCLEEQINWGLVCACLQPDTLGVAELTVHQHQALFMLAAKHGRVDILALMLRINPLFIIARDDDGNMAIHIAYENQAWLTVEFLIALATVASALIATHTTSKGLKGEDSTAPTLAVITSSIPRLLEPLGKSESFAQILDMLRVFVQRLALDQSATLKLLLSTGSISHELLFMPFPNGETVLKILFAQAPLYLDLFKVLVPLQSLKDTNPETIAAVFFKKCIHLDKDVPFLLLRNYLLIDTDPASLELRMKFFEMRNEYGQTVLHVICNAKIPDKDKQLMLLQIEFILLKAAIQLGRECEESFIYKFFQLRDNDNKTPLAVLCTQAEDIYYLIAIFSNNILEKLLPTEIAVSFFRSGCEAQYKKYPEKDHVSEETIAFFHLACAKAPLSVVQELLSSYPALLNCRNSDNKSPCDTALEAGQYETKIYLQLRGGCCTAHKNRGDSIAFDTECWRSPLYQREPDSFLRPHISHHERRACNF